MTAYSYKNGCAYVTYQLRAYAEKVYCHFRLDFFFQFYVHFIVICENATHLLPSESFTCQEISVATFWLSLFLCSFVCFCLLHKTTL